MKKQLSAAVLAAMVMTPVALPTTAMAQNYDHGRYDHSDRGGDYRFQDNRDPNWDPAAHYRAGQYPERRLGRNDYVYRGRNGRYYCRRNDGTTGLVVGAIGGGVLGNVLGGGGALGTLLGAGGGALLGRSVDRGNVRCR